jgi:hypothetical protein
MKITLGKEPISDLSLAATRFRIRRNAGAAAAARRPAQQDNGWEMVRALCAFFRSGALKQMFGSKSRGGRGSLSINARCLCEYRTSSSTWSRCLAGPFFLDHEGLNFTASGFRRPGKLWLSILRAVLRAACAFPGGPAARQMARSHHRAPGRLDGSVTDIAEPESLRVYVVRKEAVLSSRSRHPKLVAGFARGRSSALHAGNARGRGRW